MTKKVHFARNMEKTKYYNIHYWNDKNTAHILKSLLTDGKVVLGTSDTVLGLLAPATEEGRHALDSIKKRSEKPYILLIGNILTAQRYAHHIPEDIKKLMSTFWPGPLTIILPASASVPQTLLSSDRLVALRMPAHKGLLSILNSLPALFSTSANISGKPVPHTVQDVDAHLLNTVSCVVLDKSEKESSLINPLPSTIIQCTGKGIELIRAGALNPDKIEKTLGKKLIYST